MEVSRKYKEINDLLQCHLNIMIEVIADRQFSGTEQISSQLIFLIDRFMQLKTQKEWHEEKK